MSRPPILSDGCWRELGEAGRVKIGVAWQKLCAGSGRSGSDFVPAVESLYQMTENFRVMAIAKQLSDASERGEFVAPYAVRSGSGSVYSRLLPLLSDAELDEVETMIRWVQTAERAEDKEYLTGQLNARLAEFSKRLS